LLALLALLTQSTHRAQPQLLDRIRVHHAASSGSAAAAGAQVRCRPACQKALRCHGGAAAAAACTGA
jgi:hypothetical protein